MVQQNFCINISQSNIFSVFNMPCLLQRMIADKMIRKLGSEA